MPAKKAKRKEKKKDKKASKKLAPKDDRLANIDEDAACRKQARQAQRLEEALKKRNKAKCCSTATAGAPSREAEEEQPEPTEPTEKVERPTKMICQLMEGSDEARARGKIPPATPATTSPAALGVSLPGTDFCWVPMEDELLPDTNILNCTLPDEPSANYLNLQPLTIDDTTLEANLTSETMSCLGSAPTVATHKGPRPPIAEKVPRLEIQQKYNEMLAE